MSEYASGTGSGGIGIVELLGVAFVVLKLCGVIAWSWVWVLSPFWMPVAAVLSVVILWKILSAVFE